MWSLSQLSPVVLLAAFYFLWHFSHAASMVQTTKNTEQTRCRRHCDQQLLQFLPLFSFHLLFSSPLLLKKYITFNRNTLVGIKKRKNRVRKKNTILSPSSGSGGSHMSGRCSIKLVDEASMFQVVFSLQWCLTLSQQSGLTSIISEQRTLITFS